MPVPWRSGTITTPALMREQRADLARVQRRAVAGDEQDALGAALERGFDPAGGGGGLARLDRVVDDDARRCRRSRPAR